jgi:DNA-binding SARP family transcriptional activator
MGLFRLRTFGGLALYRSGADGLPVVGAATQRRPLAVLAVLAAAGARGVTRDRLVLRLWPESEPERARNVLKQTLYALRRDLNEPKLVTGAVELVLNSAVITSDVGEFEAAIDNGEFARAAALYTGPFVDGVYLNDAPEFERWAADERRRLERRALSALRTLANDATRRNDRTGAVSWWRRLAEIDPADSRVTANLMAALAATRDRAGALQAARAHERFMRAEFEAPIDPVVSALADEIRKRCDTGRSS